MFIVSEFLNASQLFLKKKHFEDLSFWSPRVLGRVSKNRLLLAGAGEKTTKTEASETSLVAGSFIMIGVYVVLPSGHQEPYIFSRGSLWTFICQGDHPNVNMSPHHSTPHFSQPGGWSSKVNDWSIGFIGWALATPFQDELLIPIDKRMPGRPFEWAK